MKIIVIGDIHGRDVRKKIVKQEFDYCVFIGDYFDSFDIPIDKQISNFKQIIKFKKDNSEKVKLLIGNHDYHYLDNNERYSGFDHYTQLQIGSHLTQYVKKGLLEYYIKLEDCLYSHAGISRSWLESNGTFDYHINDGSRSGEDVMQGPLWIRPKALRSDPLMKDGLICKQVFGHTMQDSIVIGDLTCVDCLHHGQYLVIEDGIYKVHFV